MVNDYQKYFDEHYKDHLINTAQYSDRYVGFSIMFEELLKKKGGNFNIIETGTIRNPNNWCDGQSTLLFYDFLRNYGGNLLSIDIDQHYLNVCKQFINSYRFPTDFNNLPYFKQICGDSVLELSKINTYIDLIYLDSFDLDVKNPEPSMVHHLKEMISLSKTISSSEDVIIAVDDNFGDIGKGKYVLEWAKDVGAEILHEGYQVIFKL